MALYDVLLVARPALPAAAHARRRLRLLLRAAGLAAVLGTYVWLRHALTGGQQLVKVFRKVPPSLLSASAAESLYGMYGLRQAVPASACSGFQWWLSVATFSDDESLYH